MRAHHTPSTGLHTRAGQRKYLTPGERARFLAAASALVDARLRTLCLTLAHTGCRISEALAVTAGAVDLEGGLIAVRCLKKRRGQIVIRAIPAPPELLAMLERTHHLAEACTSKRLWTLSRGRAWFLVKVVMRQALITEGPHMTAKGLRHGFGLHAIRCGVPLNLVQRWLGHASLATTAIYLQAVGDEEREFAARMWAGPREVPEKSMDSNLSFLV